MRKAYIYAFAASIFWGAGFIGFRYALEAFDPMWIIHLRFLIATVLLLPFLFASKRVEVTRELIVQSSVCGLFVVFMMFLQVKGVDLTTIAKSSFLTITYSFFTPLLGYLFFKEKISFFFLVCTFASMVGILFLCDFEISNFNIGDGIIIVSALFTSFQLVYLSKFLKNVTNLMLFNFFQMLSVTIYSLVLALVFEGVDKFYEFNLTQDLNAFLGIIFMGIFSTALAFVFQVKCQKYLKAHIAGLIYLVESPIAAVLAYFLFMESLNSNGILGCGIIFLATVMVLVEENKLNKKKIISS